MRRAPDKYIAQENGRWFEVVISYPGHTSKFDEHETESKTELAPVISNYQCRTCSAKKFNTHHENQTSFFDDQHLPARIGPSGSREIVKIISGYSCPNCGVPITDPTKWSRNRPSVVVKPEATPRPDRFMAKEKIDNFTEIDDALTVLNDSLGG